MKASVILTIQIPSAEKYVVNLNIPTSAPSKDQPFHFKVTQEQTKDDTNVVQDDILHVAIGDESAYYVGVAPPKSILEDVGIGNIVKGLDVIVQEGNYNIEEEKFN